jgi:hypothetical protein
MVPLHLTATTTDPRVDLVAACVFTLMSAGFFYFGVRILTKPDPIVRFYRSLGSRLIGEKRAARVYNEGNLKVAAIGFVILGPIFIVVGIVFIWQKALLVFA